MHPHFVFFLLNPKSIDTDASKEFIFLCRYPIVTSSTHNQTPQIYCILLLHKYHPFKSILINDCNSG